MKFRKVSYLVVALITMLTYSALAQCTLTLSDYTQAEVLSCLTSCGCSEVVVPDGTTVNMTGDWDLTSAGAITFTIEGSSGSLVFSNVSGNFDELIMASGSVIIIEDTSNSNALASTPPAGGQIRITIGVTEIRGIDFNDIIVGGGADETWPAPLPIELIYFSATTKNKKVELSWATASEENFNYFSIERSFDGREFKEIAQVTGKGSSFQRLDYSYNDNFPAIGISYYRLRSIDFDGYTEIFDYAMANVEGAKYTANVYPNPVTAGRVNVQVNFNLEEDAQVLFYNNMGIVELELATNSWLKPLDVSSLTQGSYLIKIITNEGVFVKRILIR